MQRTQSMQNDVFQIKFCKSDSDILDTYNVMQQLRKVEQAEYLARINHQRKQGYQLVSLYDEQSVCRGVLGFKTEDRLYPGKIIYVFDLVIDQTARSHGYGAKLISWLKQQAVEQNCKAIVLDSGVQRPKAHKFYFNQGFEVTSYNFKMFTPAKEDKVDFLDATNIS